MSQSKVNIDKMLTEFTRQYQSWFAVLDQNIQKQAIEDTARKTVQYLKTHSPKHTGRYASTWKADRNNHWRGAYRYSMTVYNHKNYRLTHLLEYGHLKRNGERTDAQPHIEPAERIAAEILVDEVLDVISKSI